MFCSKYKEKIDLLKSIMKEKDDKIVEWINESIKWEKRAKELESQLNNKE